MSQIHDYLIENKKEKYLLSVLISVLITELKKYVKKKKKYVIRTRREVLIVLYIKCLTLIKSLVLTLDRRRWVVTVYCLYTNVHSLSICV